MALYATHLLLDVTEASIIPQGQVLLRWVSAEVYGHFKAKLLEDEERLKREQASLHFKPTHVEVFPENLTVHITGNLMTYVGAKRVSELQETYQVKFINQQGKLLLGAFELLKGEENRDA
jgi:type IV conjugative transfer system protein TraE